MRSTIISVVTDACFAVTCGACGKTTWKGCGQHVDSVSWLGDLCLGLGYLPVGHYEKYTDIRP
ncbi:hypothetical protein B0J17DRAFT_648559 [Rhizoctonia solani]|nr:hypothetical protein B0J17DRAFT_648559 [Rhizoctonia solani]